MAEFVETMAAILVVIGLFMVVVSVVAFGIPWLLYTFPFYVEAIRDRPGSMLFFHGLLLLAVGAFLAEAR